MLTEDFQHSSEDQGVLVLAVRRDSDTPSQSINGKYSALLTDSFGRLKVSGELGVSELISSSSGANTSVANAVSNTALLAANDDRKGATIFNDSASSILKIALGFAASNTAFTAVIQPQGYYEVPFNFTGAINGYSSIASGNARITEVS